VIFSHIDNKSESLVAELLESASFSSVKFSHTSFYSAALDKFVPALSKSKVLTDLDMRACDIEMKGDLVAKIVENTTSIKKLNLYHNLMGDGFLPIAEALKTNSSMYALEFPNSSTQKTASNFHIMCSEELILPLNYLEEQHFTALAAALKANTTLTKLDVSENDAREAGIAAFAAALPEMKSLLHLNISETKAKDAGTTAVAKALHGNSVLQSLILHSVGLKQDGCIAVADCLKHNSTLRKLDICGNSVPAHGLVALATALAEKYDLRGKDIT
jgi:Ran GTPase-activating protein (RanGAP) involved in mRNA processing and transport